jgi:hypothetical protein
MAYLLDLHIVPADNTRQRAANSALAQIARLLG